MRRLLQTFVHAAFKPHAYAELLRSPFSRALGYVFWLLVCVSVAWSVVLGVQYLQNRAEIVQTIHQVRDFLPDAFPADATLTISGGVLSTNLQEPYVWGLPFELDSDAEDDSTMPSHFLVIDTNGSVENYKDYDSFALATRTYVAVPNDDGGIQIIAYEDVTEESVTIDRPFYDQTINTVLPYVRAAPLIIDILALLGILLFPFLLGGSYWLFSLGYLVIWTLPIWAAGNLMKRGVRYSVAWRIGLYGLTWPTLYDLLCTAIPALRIGLLPTALLLGWSLYVLLRLPRVERSAKKREDA